MSYISKKMKQLWLALLLALSNLQQTFLSKVAQQPISVSQRTAAEEAAYWKNPLTSGMSRKQTPMERAETFLDYGQIVPPSFVKGRRERIQWVFRSMPKTFWL